MVLVPVNRSNYAFHLLLSFVAWAPLLRTYGQWFSLIFTWTSFRGAFCKGRRAPIKHTPFHLTRLAFNTHVANCQRGRQHAGSSMRIQDFVGMRYELTILEALWTLFSIWEDVSSLLERPAWLASVESIIISQKYYVYMYYTTLHIIK